MLVDAVGVTETLTPAEAARSVRGPRRLMTLLLAVLAAVAAFALTFDLLAVTHHGGVASHYTVTIRPVQSGHQYCEVWATSTDGGWYGGSSATDWPTGSVPLHRSLDVADQI